MPINQNSINLAGHILIIDDEAPNLQLLSELLGKEGYHVRPAKQPQMAIKSALAQPPSLILLDVRMPDMDGFEVCKRLKQDGRTCDIPIIFISALQDVHSRVHGLEAGGVDFISKPVPGFGSPGQGANAHEFAKPAAESGGDCFQAHR